MIKMQPPVRIYHPITMVALTGLLVLLTACQTAPKYGVGPDVDRNLVTKASLPDYVPGEYFVYDDGTSVLVTAVENGLVTWKHHNGAVSTGYPNFIIPDLTWTSADRSSQGRTTAPPDLLWPPAPGKRGQFDFEQTIAYQDGRAPDVISRSWACEVEGASRVTVPAGRFDTVVMTCNRYSSSSGSWRATQRYYFAPEVGHYVLREDRHRSGSNTRRELVAFGFNSTVLPPRDQSTLNQTLQTALTKNGDGRASFWNNPSGDISAMLVPIRSYTSPEGQSCREYQSIYSVNGRVSQHTREVCRQPDGHWQRVD